LSDLLDDLAAYSARWGDDLELVQGAGGNTSVKLDGQLHVKASGQRLKDAERQPIFVTVPLSGHAPPPSPGGLRPSIETSLHLLTPYRVTAHLHMVDVIALAVRRDARAALEQALGGLGWTWVPYAKPGEALARAISDASGGRPAEIVVLGNHGVIVGGDSFAEVDSLISDLRVRLAVAPRTGPLSATLLSELAERHGLEPACLPEAHLAAADPRSLGFATSGSLYPDHPVFLGRGAAALDPAASDLPTSDTALYLAPGAGALLRPGLPDAAHEMAACLGLVASRIAPGAPVQPLTRAQEDELIDWEAERYRRGLAEG
jgi:rhamnose utilization protein RhaD (predicted bifunctional aldolase and dehydrogenase)